MIELSPELILRAYACGVFPMAERQDDPSVFWVDPDWRGVIPLDEFHLPRRLGRTVRSGKFQITVDQAFDQVIRTCAERTAQRMESWINGDIVKVYGELHRLGNAHSVECWSGTELVGGLYGVSLGAAFFGESMFSRKTDASKVALVHLVERLRAGGYTLLDTQFVTAHLTGFGAVELPRGTYLEQLRAALERQATFYPFDSEFTSNMAQSSTQTS
ncbi:MAG: leucyl/phenylalanyl-tRNA--protein transferase [Proteobacteria bacterium]|nr:leucyl/phenylalanyl-tRNA--protein transferase [Pseudomonadota bacterium]MDA1354979.1 leucyl/phenylalanyl-tRNA--protein transferase [Pseudomonadota bacterium]